MKKSPALRALYNNLKTSEASSENADKISYPTAEYLASNDPALHLALLIDKSVKDVRPDGWRGVQTKENEIKRALLGILQNVAEVERIFLIIEKQREY